MRSLNMMKMAKERLHIKCQRTKDSFQNDRRKGGTRVLNTEVKQETMNVYATKPFEN